MKTFAALTMSLRLIGTVTAPPAVRADTADADCEVHRDGETKSGRSGASTFSLRQGNINIGLRNGGTWSLTPSGEPNECRDQKGNNVTSFYKGHGKCMVVNLDPDRSVGDISIGTGC